MSPSSPFPPALLRARAIAAARASALADARRAVRELSATLADESVSALARTAPAFEAATPGAMRDAMAFALDRVERDGAEKRATLRVVEEGLRPRRSRGSAEKVGSEGSDGGAEGAPSPELSRETLTTLVATWILSPDARKRSRRGGDDAPGGRDANVETRRRDVARMVEYSW